MILKAATMFIFQKLLSDRYSDGRLSSIDSSYEVEKCLNITNTFTNACAGYKY